MTIPKTSKNVKNIITTTAIYGVIQVLCAVISLCIQITVHNNYEKIILEQESTTTVIENIMTESYQYKSILTDFYMNVSANEDYAQEFENIEYSVRNELVLIETYIDNDYSADLKKLKTDILQLFDLKGDGDFDSFIASKFQRAVISDCTTLLSYLSIDIGEKLEAIEIQTTIAKGLSFFMIAVSIVFVGVSVLKIKSQGEKIETDSEEESYIDALTGLYNRKFIEKKLPDIVAGKSTGYLFMLDMDNFKKVNDTFGHGVGDNALIGLAEVLKATLRPDDIICRLGGDEFMIYIASIGAPAAGKAVYERVRESLNERFRDTDLSIITLSCGSVCYIDDEPFADFYKRADNALYYVKEHGKNSIHIQ